VADKVLHREHHGGIERARVQRLEVDREHGHREAAGVLIAGTKALQASTAP